MSLKSLFYPRSVAIVGASHEVGSVGNSLIKNIVENGYKGHIYPVNPKGGRLYGLPVKRMLSEIEGELDLIVVAVPAKIVPQVLHEAAHQHVQAAIVISAGFKEVGNEELEKSIAQICQKHNITLIGPNCLGLLNPEIKLNASFASIMPAKGNVAFISQSGAICSSILDLARERGMGFSKFMSIGNKALVDEAPLLEYLYRDPETKVIMMYVEQLAHIPELMRVTQRSMSAESAKPVIILKSGTTAAGSRASQSHTGALAGSEAAYNALFNQSGMIRAESISELFDLAECFSHNPPLKSKNVAVITNAGGPGVLTTDALVSQGLKLVTLSSETQARLKRWLPPAASVKNPIDILGDADAERYDKTLRLVMHDSAVQAVVVILTPQSMTQVTQTAQVIAHFKKHSRKPIIVSFMGEAAVEPGLEILHRAGVATTPFPEPAAKALGALERFQSWLGPGRRGGFRLDQIKTEDVEQLLGKAQARGETLVHSDTTFGVLKAYGLPVIKRQVVTSPSQAAEVGRRIGGKVVLKIVSPDIVHKTDVGGVVLNVEPAQVEAEYKQLLIRIKRRQPKAQIKGVELMEMVDSQGLEIILGITTDPALGKVVMVGWGGIYTEVLKDVAWGLVPVSRNDATRMVRSLAAHQIMKGVRGQPSLDEAAVIEAIGRISRLAEDFPQIQELDINPLALSPRGAKVLDGRIVLEET
jgi:acetyl coenzyme A synthetase (ADP forming)-like protein